MTGRTISHYQVLELVGSGGMGEVYKARDTRLNRLVALKVLRAERMSQKARKQRFIQEAQAASALNHPNIVTIYDIGAQDGIDFMVMEYIPGRTLDALIPRNGMRLNEALRISVQIAEGLRRAHAAGIAHRDLKPSNVIVSDEGLVKILDFGLAKLVEEAPIGENDATRTERPETEEGTVLGTVAYMSPEQAEGRKLDARTDIFSFGGVLYEMLTGRKPFAGESRASTMSAILKEEPKPLETVSVDLDKLVRRCLRKDREKRIQHMDDVKLALEEVREDSETGKAAAVPTPAAPKWRAPWIAAGAAAVCAAAGAGWYLRPDPAVVQPVELRRITADAGLSTAPALSPDGKLLAYASDRATNGENLDVWLQHLGGGDPVRLTKGDADESEPDISPDGSHVAYSSGRNGIWVIPALGGEPRQVAPHGLRPKYSPDGKWIAYHIVTLSAGEFPGEVWISPATGGSAKRIAAEFGRVRSPVWSPDSRILFVGAKDRGARDDLWFTDIDGKQPSAAGFRDAAKVAGLRGTTFGDIAAWSRERLYFVNREQDRSRIMTARISPDGKISAAIEPVTSGTSLDGSPAVSASGSLAFVSSQFRSDLWMLPADTNAAKITGPLQRITEDAAVSVTPSISEDGNTLTFISNRDGRRALWLRDMTSGKLRKISPPGARLINGATFPGLSADGSKAAYEEIHQDKPTSYVVADLSAGTFRDYPLRGWGLGPSGRHILAYPEDRALTRDGLVRAIDAATGKSSDLLAVKKYPVRSPHLSPGEKWAAFHILNTDATRQVLIAPFSFGRPAPEAEWIYVTDGKALDRDPQWSPDGNTLYWLADRDGARGIHAVRLHPTTKRPSGAPFEVRMFRGTRRSMMPFPNTAQCRAVIARDKIVFALGEETGNIWMTRLSGQ